MQNGSLFRHIDLFPAEHRLDARPQACFLCQLEEQSDRVIRDAMLRVIEK